jgi:hypothetical protein
MSNESKETSMSTNEPATRAVTISGATMNLATNEIMAHPPQTFTLPAEPKLRYHDDPPFDRENIAARMEHAFWIFDDAKRKNGGDERAAFKAAVRRLLSGEDCKQSSIALPVSVEYVDEGHTLTAAIVDVDGHCLAKMLSMDVVGCTNRTDPQAEEMAARLNASA